MCEDCGYDDCLHDWAERLKEEMWDEWVNSKDYPDESDDPDES
jgi:hypothetical protein